MNLLNAINSAFDRTEVNDKLTSKIEFVKSAAKRVLSEDEFLKFNNIPLESIKGTNDDETINNLIKCLDNVGLDSKHAVVECLFERLGTTYVLIPNSLNLFKGKAFKTNKEMLHYFGVANIVMYKIYHVKALDKKEFYRLNSALSDLYTFYYKFDDDSIQIKTVKKYINDLVDETIV